MISQPMLAGKFEDIKDVQFPCYATPKLDGIRILKVNGKVVTRKFLDVPNLHIRKALGNFLPDGMDGEIMSLTGDHAEIQSQVRRIEGEPKFVYNIFDYVKDSLDKPYLDRLDDLEKWYHYHKYNIEAVDDLFHVRLVVPIRIDNEQELIDYHDKCVNQGYEGVMIRSESSPYKCGRSSLKEGYLLKFKYFHDAEARVIGFEEKMHNDNEAEKNAFGRTKRSKKKDGLVPANTLGALILHWFDPAGNPVTFHLGTGFDHETAQHIWDNKSLFINRLANFKYQRLGSKGKPLHASFQYFRDEMDI